LLFIGILDWAEKEMIKKKDEESKKKREREITN